jgi:hypothetical protein
MFKSDQQHPVERRWSAAMEDDGDAHTLGLLVDLRNLCSRIGDEHHRMASELHDLPVSGGRTLVLPYSRRLAWSYRPQLPLGMRASAFARLSAMKNHQE